MVNILQILKMRSWDPFLVAKQARELMYWGLQCVVENPLIITVLRFTNRETKLTGDKLKMRKKNIFLSYMKNEV